MALFAFRPFLMGISIGCSLVFLIMNIQYVDNKYPRHARSLSRDNIMHKIDILISNITVHNHLDFGIDHDDTTQQRVQPEHVLKYRTSDIETRDKEVRVLIWVMTQPKNLQGPAQGVKDTWGGRADKVLYMSSEQNDTFPTIKLDVQEGRDHLTAKTMQAFRYCYEHYFNDYGWFMKADDDTYVIVENLKYFLSKFNPSEPIAFGHLFSPYMKQGEQTECVYVFVL